MKILKIYLAALATTVLASAAWAQEEGSRPPGVSPYHKMRVFYTDDSHQHMKPMDEVKRSFLSMSEEDQAMLRKMCMESVSPRDSFCNSLKTFDR